MKGLSSYEITMLVRAVLGGGILYLAISFLRDQIRSRRGSESGDSQALDELWERYTRGEISWEEYERLSRDLEE